MISDSFEENLVAEETGEPESDFINIEDPHKSDAVLESFLKTKVVTEFTGRDDKIIENRFTPEEDSVEVIKSAPINRRKSSEEIENNEHLKKITDLIFTLPKLSIDIDEEKDILSETLGLDNTVHQDLDESLAGVIGTSAENSNQLEESEPHSDKEVENLERVDATSKENDEETLKSEIPCDTNKLMEESGRVIETLVQGVEPLLNESLEFDQTREEIQIDSESNKPSVKITKSVGFNETLVQEDDSPNLNEIKESAQKGAQQENIRWSEILAQEIVNESRNLNIEEGSQVQSENRIESEQEESPKILEAGGESETLVQANEDITQRPNETTEISQVQPKNEIEVEQEGPENSEDGRAIETLPKDDDAQGQISNETGQVQPEKVVEIPQEQPSLEHSGMSETSTEDVHGEISNETVQIQPENVIESPQTSTESSEVSGTSTKDDDVQGQTLKENDQIQPEKVIETPQEQPGPEISEEQPNLEKPGVIETSTKEDGTKSSETDSSIIDFGILFESRKSSSENDPKADTNSCDSHTPSETKEIENSESTESPSKWDVNFEEKQ